MAAGLGPTVSADEEKTRVIRDFLVDGGEGSKRCLVVIGAGGSGKTRALTTGLLEDWVGCGLCGPAVRFLQAQPAAETCS